MMLSACAEVMTRAIGSEHLAFPAEDSCYSIATESQFCCTTGHVRSRVDEILRPTITAQEFP
jgi:hypothetical protein